MDGTESENGPRGTFEIYRAEGDSLYKNGEYRKAIDSYTTALELKQGDKDCLVARSRCHLQLGDTDQALHDADTSLEENKEFHKGLFQKAEALYCKGEFELALVFYHRGHKLRPELQEFRLGIQKAQEAIDNSVGSPEQVKLTKEGDLSFFHRQDEKKTKGRGGGGYGLHRPPTRTQTMAKRQAPASNDKTIKQLLGELYGDKVYLEKLLKETDPTSDSGRPIYDLVCEGLRYLDTRTEFWRQQKPMYARKRDRMMNQRNASDNKSAPNQYVVKELEKIDEAQSEGRFEESLRRAKKCLRVVEGYPEGAIANRHEVVSQLHSCLGNAYLELGQYDKALTHHQKDMEIGKQYEIEDAQSRAADNLGRVYARMGEFQKAIDSWNSKLSMAKSAVEKTWLFHEIGRCYLELGDYAQAKSYGEQSTAAAAEADDDMWQLNATVLLAQAEVKLKDYQAALEAFERALDMAKVQGDEAAETAIKKAIEDVNSKIAQSVKEGADKQTEEPTTQEPEKEAEPEAEQEPEREPSPAPKEPTPEPTKEEEAPAEQTQDATSEEKPAEEG